MFFWFGKIKIIFKDQIYSDNAAITPVTYDFNNTVPGAYAVVNNSGTATVGGTSTSNSGTQYTVASGDASGLVLNITASTTSGTIYIGKSHITKLEQNLNAFIKYNGLIDQKLEGNRQRLTDVAEKKISLENSKKLYDEYKKEIVGIQLSIKKILIELEKIEAPLIKE